MTEPAGAQDPLATLREHVRSAQQAAERLARSAGSSSAPGGAHEASSAGARQSPPGGAHQPPPGAGETPPSGWASDADRETAAELRALVDLVESLRAMLPDELSEQLTEVIRQLLLLMRAIIDWLVARIEREGAGREVEVQDIPVL